MVTYCFFIGLPSLDTNLPIHVFSWLLSVAAVISRNSFAGSMTKSCSDALVLIQCIRTSASEEITNLKFREGFYKVLTQYFYRRSWGGGL